jgi:hypothetical protein
MSARPEVVRIAGTLDPDEIAAEAWDLYEARDRAEATFNAMV